MDASSNFEAKVSATHTHRENWSTDSRALAVLVNCFMWLEQQCSSTTCVSPYRYKRQLCLQTKTSINITNQEDNNTTNRDPCWSWENSTMWFAMSDNCMFGIWLLRKSSNSWLRPVTSFDAAVLQYICTFKIIRHGSQLSGSVIATASVTVLPIKSQVLKTDMCPKCQTSTTYSAFYPPWDDRMSNSFWAK